jgi:hypothetical protein
MHKKSLANCESADKNDFDLFVELLPVGVIQKEMSSTPDFPFEK